MSGPFFAGMTHMVKTYGLSHIALKVADPERSVRFYRSVFGVEEYFRDADSIQVKGPGPYDVIAFERGTSEVGVVGGIAHFGFRLTAPSDIDKAVAESVAAGGRLMRRGEFAPGLPFAYISDPDGYEIEIWYE
jgi:catechol 2,3-dioxygenase-like lactoylglutathione lyase family enzyme